MTNDEELLLQAVAVASAAREHGNHPFGALLVDADGAVLLSAENTVVTERDATGQRVHADRYAAQAAVGDSDHSQDHSHAHSHHDHDHDHDHGREGDEPLEGTELVFIGRGMPTDEIIARFDACLAPEGEPTLL